MKLHWIEDGTIGAGAVPVSVDDIRALHADGVRAILTLTEHPITRFDGVDAALFESLEIDYLHTPIDDHTAPTVTQASEGAQYINRMKALGKPVYVHCAAGIGRTGTMLHAYYVIEGLSLEDAKVKVREAKQSSQYILLSGVQQTFLEDLSRELNPSTQNVLDLWHVPVLPGAEAEFMKVFRRGERWLMDADGYIGYEVRRNAEQPSMYLLLIRWTSFNASEAFLESAGYRAMERSLQPFLMDDPLIERYEFA
ncbi:MAG: dual specificity protein phosphatase family protein [Aggregatilineales bacterium]